MASASSQPRSSSTLCTQSQNGLSSSSMLWAHLQRKDASSLTPGSGIPLPPLAPIDKTSTSLRILLHDTQSHFETFSERVDKLTKSVEDAKRDIVQTKDLFEKDHEELGSEIYSLANRCQTEILKAVGQPAQASAIGELQREMHMRLEGLDKRLDSMQSLYQTSAQTLHLQAQALQTIQEQQSTILSSLMPLLPLLQAVPLHVDTARHSVQDSISKAFSGLAIVRTTPSSRKRTHAAKESPLSSIHPGSSPMAVHKRRRLNEQSSDGPQPSSGERTSVTSLRPSIQRPSMFSDRFSAHRNKRTPLATLNPKMPRQLLTDSEHHSTAGPANAQPRRTSLSNRHHPAISALTSYSMRIVQQHTQTASSSPLVAPLSIPKVHPNMVTQPTHVLHASLAPRSGIQATPQNKRPPMARTDTVSNPAALAMPPLSLRQRRSPFRQGRRFIPLDDSDDSEGENNGS